MEDSKMTLDLNSVQSYDYFLPEDRIAQEPVSPRDASRLMVIDRAKGKWEHRFFYELPEIINQNYLMVSNNTKVLKARLLGNRIRIENAKKVLGGAVEFVLLEEIRPRVWEGLFHASAKYVSGLMFQIPTPDGKGLNGVLVRGSADSPSGTVVAEFDRDPVESGAGELPLPHYIQRSPQLQDEESYQTYFAKKLGSAAAPTAGLHFTPRVIEKLRQNQIQQEEITLHVGLGTFRPVKTNDIRQHSMHEERYEISEKVVSQIQSARKNHKKILAIGTTTVRALESAWDPAENELVSGMGRTSIFIYPGSHSFQVVDCLLTNFHLPKSTLLMLVCALGGRELMMEAYQEAIAKKYRFFSYGDAMLIL